MAISRPGQQGFALLSAVWALVILLIIASGLIALSRGTRSSAATTMVQSRSRAFAEAISVMAAARLEDADETDRPRVDGVSMNISVLGTMVQLSIQDEFGKLDLNTANIASLASFFKAFGLTSVDAEKAAAVINDRRAHAALPPTDGRPEHPINAFESPSDLLDIPGVSRELYERMAPGLTVYSGLSQIDQQTAPFEALLSLPGMTVSQAKDIVSDRLSGETNGQSASPVKNGRVEVGVNQLGWPFRVSGVFCLSGRTYDDVTVIRLTVGALPAFLVSYQEISVISGQCG